MDWLQKEADTAKEEAERLRKMIHQTQQEAEKTQVSARSLFYVPSRVSVCAFVWPSVSVLQTEYSCCWQPVLMLFMRFH